MGKTLANSFNTVSLEGHKVEIVKDVTGKNATNFKVRRVGDRDIGDFGADTSYLLHATGMSSNTLYNVNTAGKLIGNVLAPARDLTIAGKAFSKVKKITNANPSTKEPSLMGRLTGGM